MYSISAHHDFYSNLPIFVQRFDWNSFWSKQIHLLPYMEFHFHYKNYTFCTHSTGSGHMFSFETLLYLVHSYELSRICHTRDTTQELFLVGCELWCFLTHFDDFGNGSHSSQHKYLLSTYMYLVQMPSIAPHMYK